MNNVFWAYYLHDDDDNSVTLDALSRLTSDERKNYSVIMFGEENPVPYAIVLTEYVDVVTKALNSNLNPK